MVSLAIEAEAETTPDDFTSLFFNLNTTRALPRSMIHGALRLGYASADGHEGSDRSIPASGCRVGATVACRYPQILVIFLFPLMLFDCSCTRFVWFSCETFAYAHSDAMKLILLNL